MWKTLEVAEGMAVENIQIKECFELSNGMTFCVIAKNKTSIRCKNECHTVSIPYGIKVKKVICWYYGINC